MRPVDHALALATLWPVFPCDHRKHPRTPHGFKDATTTRETIEEWWTRWPTATVGVSCGPAALVVVDCDTPKSGEIPPERWRQPGMVDGSDVFVTLLHDNGCGYPTHVVYTPSGGMHCYYRAPDGVNLPSPVRAFPMVDIRAGGAYVIAAGPGYVRCGVNIHDIQPVPWWLVDAITNRAHRAALPSPTKLRGDPNERLQGVLRTLGEARNGERNTLLHWAACRVREMTDTGTITDPDGAVGMLAELAAGLGLDTAETTRTIHSALTGPAR